MVHHKKLGSETVQIAEKYDVVIIGGGMVGAALAIGLAKQNRTVAVVEGREPPPFESSQPMDVRVSAISSSSVDLLQSLGAWDAIASMRLCPYKRLETWELPECRTRFHSDALSLSELGFIVENRVIQLGLWQQFATYDNLTSYCPDSLTSIQLDDESIVELASGKHLQATWIVGADGANSMVRQQAGIGVTAWDYRHHCMLINVETEKPQQDITWQQFTPSGPRSFLPLPGHQGSLVWYDSPQRIQQLSVMNDEQLRDEILAHFPEELGDIKVLQHASFPLTRRHAQQYFRQGCVVVGDAAHTINPLAGQGVNLGFKDVQALLSASEPENALTNSALEKYQSLRRNDNLLMQTGMDLFYKGFSNDNMALRVVRNMALKAAEHAGPIKHSVLKYALGL